VTPPVDLNALSLPDLYRTLCERGTVRRLIELARDEDLPGGKLAADVTSMVAVGDEQCTAVMRARRPGMIAGLATLDEVVRVFGANVRVECVKRDGDAMAAGDVLAKLTGPARHVLGIERTALNLVSRLSGVATLTKRYVDAAASGKVGGARVYDTRKTTPGLRMLEKYAVRCGGGCCHRLDLGDAILIKDNHIAGVNAADLGPRVRELGNEARQRFSSLRFVMVEVDGLEQLQSVLRSAASVVDIVLLDNMDAGLLRKAAQMRDEAATGGARRVELEASGGVTLETIGGIAGTGVDRISIGALTHQAVSVDIGLDIDLDGDLGRDVGGKA
jgi:nicotinate-nucleotide pyrophosphorylase (carboxylating)